MESAEGNDAFEDAMIWRVATGAGVDEDEDDVKENKRSKTWVQPRAVAFLAL